MRILDIGCGWGGLSCYLSQLAEVEVTGVTLSKEQYRKAQERAQAQGIERVKFVQGSYHEISGPYDRIISVGMFEHLGKLCYQAFFEHIERLLSPGGIMLLHSIGRQGVPQTTFPWLRKYIFPGGYIPSLTDVLLEIEKTSLWVTDLEILRLHYAYTLQHWRQRFVKNREQIRDLYDERFCRMWECYLTIAEILFLYGQGMVFQLQLSNNHGSSVPIVRDYMIKTEALYASKKESLD